MKFDLVYADVPWRFKNWSMSELAKRGEKWARRNGRSPYNVMTSEDIAALPISDIAARDSVLCFWATDPKLNEAMDIIKAWGYEYKTVLFTWVKTNPLGLKMQFGDLANLICPYLGKRGFEEQVRIPPELVGGWHFGLGYHTRSNPEMVLLATRGKGLKRVDNTIAQLVISPLGEHSKKPDEVRYRIERLYGDVSRVELFARYAAPGWMAIGDAIDGKDIRRALKEIANA